VVDWHTLIQIDDMEFPVDTESVPDVFIYLVPEGDIAHVCFARVKSKDLLAKNSFMNKAQVTLTTTIIFLHLTCLIHIISYHIISYHIISYHIISCHIKSYHITTQWFQLKEDKVIDALDDDDYPGQVLARIGLGKSEDGQASETDWKDALVKMQDKQQYLVRVNLFQCRDLIPVDDNGLSDPYLRVQFYGHSANTYRKERIKPKPDDKRDNRTSDEMTGRIKTNETRHKSKTLYPTYYETFDFTVEMTPEKEFMPMVTLQAFDHNKFTFDKKLGIAHFNLNQAMTSLDSTVDNYLDPEWVPFFFEEEGDGQGSALVSAMIVPIDPEERIIPPASIEPETHKAYVEIVVVGLRNLAPYNFKKMVNPFLEIETSSNDDSTNGVSLSLSLSLCFFSSAISNSSSCTTHTHTNTLLFPLSPLSLTNKQPHTYTCTHAHMHLHIHICMYTHTRIQHEGKQRHQNQNL